MPRYKLQDEYGTYALNSDVDLDDEAIDEFYQTEIARPRAREDLIQSAASTLMAKDDAALSAAGRSGDFLGISALAIGASAAIDKARGIDPRKDLNAYLEYEGSPSQLEAVEQSDLQFESKINEAVIGLPPEDRKAVLTDIRTLAEVNRGFKDAAMVNGYLRLNPELVWDPERAASAITTADASDDQKESLIAALPGLRKRAAEAELPIFNELTEFQDFKKAHPELKTPEDQIQAYKNENSSWYDKLGAQAKLGLAQGRAQLAQQIQGATGALLRKASEIMPFQPQVVRDEIKALGDTFIEAAVTDTTAESEKLSRLSQAVGGAPIVSEFTAGGTSIVAPMLVGVGTGRLASAFAKGAAAEATAAQLASRAGFAGAIGASGLQSFGATYPQAVAAYEQRFIEQGMDPVAAREQAADAAYLPAVLSGISTAAVTALGGKKGVESVFRLKDQTFKATVGTFFKEIMKDVSSEALEEGVDEFTQGMIALHTYDPDRPMDEIAVGAFKASAIGGLLGGGVSSLKSITQQWEQQKVAPAAEMARNSGAPATADALDQVAIQESERKWAAAEEALAAQSEVPLTEVPGFDPNNPTFSSDDAPEVTESKIQAVLQTKDGKSPEEQQAIDNLIADVRQGAPQLDIFAPQISNETTTPVEDQSIPEPAESTVTQEPVQEATTQPEDQAVAPTVNESSTVELVERPIPPTPDEAGEVAPEVYEQRAAKITNPDTTSYAEMERNDAAVYPPAPVPEGAELRWNESGKKGTKGVRPNTWLPTVTVNGVVSDYFTNRVDTTAQQIDKGRTVEVPANFVESGALNPRINVRKDGDRYVVSSVEHPRFGRVDKPDTYSRAYKSDEGRATKQQQQTGGGTQFASKYDRFDPSGLKAQKDEARRMRTFESAAVRARGDLEESFTPEVVDQLISTARQYHLYRMRKGEPSSPSTTLNMVRQDYGEKVAARPEAQRQASLDAPVGEGTTTTGDLVSTIDARTERTPADQARAALAEVVGRMSPPMARAWAAVAEKMNAGAELTPQEQARWERVAQEARRLYDTDDDTLRAAARGRIDTATIKRLQSGYYVADRVSQEAERGGAETGGKIAEAAGIARGSHGSVRDAEGRELKEFSTAGSRAERFRGRYEVSRIVRPQEEKDLRAWAQANDLMLDGAEFDKFWQEQGEKGGTENAVYFDADQNRWWKRNNLVMHADWLEFFNRMLLHNQLFPAAAIRFEGFVETDTGLEPVFSQPHIRSIRGATFQEVKPYMEARGYQHLEGNNYINPETGIIVEDLHDENAVISVDPDTGAEQIIIIDPIIFLDMESKVSRLLDMAFSGQTLGSPAMAADMAEQTQWLSEQAKSAGFDSLNSLVTTAPARFMELAQQWRTEHPQTYAPNVYKEGPDPNPLIEGLRGALAEVAPGIELAIGVDTEGSVMWAEDGRVMVDPAALQTVLAEHPEETRENVTRKILDEEVAHIAGVQELSREEAVNLGLKLSERTAEQVARQYVRRSHYATDEDYEQAVSAFKERPYQMAHEYLRMLSQRLRTGEATEDLLIPQEPGFIAMVGRYLSKALTWLRTRLELAFSPELAGMVTRLEAARRGLSLRPQVMEDLGLNAEDLEGPQVYGITAADVDQVKSLPPSSPADFEAVGAVQVHKFISRLAESNPFYQRVIDEAQKYPGLKLGMGRDFAEYWAGDPYMVRIGDNLDQLIGEQDVAAVLRHEVIHSLTYNLSGEEKVQAIAEEMTPAQREQVARAYLSSSPIERTEAELERDIKAMDKDDFRVAYEYVRQVTEEILDGSLSESRMAELQANPTIFQQVMEYLQGFIQQLREFIRSNPDSTAVQEANRIAEFLAMAGEDAPVLRSSARLNTTSLHRILSAVDPETERILGEKEYISDTINNTERIADEWIELNGGITTVTQGDELLTRVDGAYLGDEQRQMVKAKIALKYKMLMEAIANGPALPEKAALFDHLKRQHQRILIGLQEQGSRTGQLLSLFKGISKLFVPDTFRRQYVGKLTQQQATVATEAGTREVAGALDTGRKAGAKAAVDRALKALKKVLPTDDPAQGLFDFFADALSLRERGVVQGTGLSPLEELKQDVAKRVSKMMLAQANVKPGESLFAVLNEKVTAAVQAQIKAPVYGPDEAPATDEEKLRALLSSLADQVSSLDLVEQAFNQAVQDTLAATPQPMEARVARLKGLKFDREKYLNAAKFVTKALNFKELVTQTLEQQDSALFNLLASLTSSTGLEGEQARLLGEAIQSAYDLEAKRVARQRLDAIVRAKEPKIRISEAKITKLLKLLNLGAFSEEKFYNAIAESYGLPTYNDEFADEVERRGAEIQKMPEGSDVQNEAIQKLMADIAKERTKGLKGFKKAMYYIGDVAPAVWQAGILSGVPTQTVNLGASEVNTLLNSIATAGGYAVAGQKAGVSLFQLVTDAFSSFTQSTGREEFKQALKTGTNRFRNERGNELSVLERSRIGKFHKYVSRFMAASDALIQAQANDALQRMALRYMWAQEGRSKKEIRDLMRDAFNPAQNVLDQIDAQVESESQWLPTKLDKARRRSALIEKRRFELMSGLDELSRNWANESTLNNEPKGMLGMLAKQLNSILGLDPFKPGKFFFSFLNTMANLTNSALDWSPIGVVRGYNLVGGESWGKYARNFEPGSPEQYTELLKGITGTAAMMALAAAMKMGWDEEDEGKEPFLAIYGEGPKDYAKKVQLQQGSSWQPNTIKIGNTRLRYTDWPMLSQALGVMGQLSDLRRWRKKTSSDLTASDYGKASIAIGSQLTQKSMFAGLKNLSDLISDPEGRGPGALKRLTSGIIGGYTNPQIAKWARDTLSIDKDGMVPQLDQSTFKGWMLSMVPFAAGQGEPALNVLGEEIKSFPWNATLKRYGNFDEEPDHPILSPLVKNNLFIKAPGVTSTIEVNGEKVRIDADEKRWRKFVQFRGEEIKKRLTPAKIERITALDHDEAQEVLDGQVTSDATDAAKRRLERELRTK